MLDGQGLIVVESQDNAVLRKRMSDAGCVFDFVVTAVEPGAPVNEATHRQALLAMRTQILLARHEWQQSVRLLPDYSGWVPPNLTWELERAIATPLDRARMFEAPHGAATCRWEDSLLFDAFRAPPYGIRLADEAALALFREWLELLGLDEQGDIVVFDWVAGLQSERDRNEGDPGTMPWSNYFEDGLEWWGIWCLTIWNPRRRLLSALVASATD